MERYRTSPAHNNLERTPIGFRRALSIVVVLSACTPILPAATSSGQVQLLSTAFDGKYAGTATQTGGRADVSCRTIASVTMTITKGQVVIDEIRYAGGRPTFQGSINAAGEITASYYRKNVNPRTGVYIETVSGAIHDQVFIGEQQYGTWCIYRLRMIKE